MATPYLYGVSAPKEAMVVLAGSFVIHSDSTVLSSSFPGGHWRQVDATTGQYALSLDHTYARLLSISVTTDAATATNEGVWRVTSEAVADAEGAYTAEDTEEYVGPNLIIRHLGLVTAMDVGADHEGDDQVNVASPTFADADPTSQTVYVTLILLNS